MSHIDVMKQALEALVESLDDVRECFDNLIPSSASYDRCVKYYEQQIDRHEAAITALRQALADAALDKMADNARELGLSYEQPAPAQCWKCGDMDAQFQAKCTVPYCAMKEQAAPAQEPDPDELTIAYMSGVYEGKKRKPWVGLTNKEISEIHDAAFGKNIGVATGLVEKKLKEKNQ